jgi:hypothetical protein
VKPLRTKSELLDLAIAAAPTRAIARRLREVGAAAFGGVTSPEGFPGWIVQYEPGPPGRFIGIWVDERAQTYRLTYSTELPQNAVPLKGERL